MVPGFTLDEFRSLYEPRPPKWKPDDIEAIPIIGAMLLPYAPADDILLGKPRESRNDSGTNTYIWVINQNGIPYALDVGLIELSDQRPKHTNLIGGGRAYSGRRTVV